MSAQIMGAIAPLASPLPPPPKGEPLTPSQWRTLLAIANTIIPALEVSTSPSSNRLGIQASEYAAAVETLSNGLQPGTPRDLPQSYLAENFSSAGGAEELLHRTLMDYVNTDARKGMSFILSALDTRAGCLLLTGYSTSFHLQPVAIRQQILQRWTVSYLAPLRLGVKSLSLLSKAIWLKSSPTLGPMLGFPRAPVHGKPGKGYEYSFIQFPPGSKPEIIETDVVIIGSGCGGGVSAKNLAEAGNRVIVVEKAYHYPAEHLPMTEKDAGIHLFQNGGVESSDDNSIATVAGQAWGGGGTVNWSASLQTQAFVRTEWAKGGLPFFTSSTFQESLDRVCERMGVSTEYIEHNKTNQVLLDGSRRLGYSCKVVPQNTGGKKHHCGYCTLGCGSAEKQGPTVSWLPDAERAGAKFVEGFEARTLFFEQKAGKKTCTGVRGVWRSRDSNLGVSGHDRTSREIILKAKRVIVSAGTLQSPLLLLRSGLKNPQIGRNLHLHPVAFVGAIYPEETRPWEGAILTAVVDEFQNLDQHGHGAKLEAMTMLPSWFLPTIPWTSGLDYKLITAKMKNMTAYISLARDRDSGRVYPDPVDGRCRISYTPSAFDRSHCLEGMLALAKICYISGAREVFTCVSGVSSFTRDDSITEPPSLNDPPFQAWLGEIRKKGLVFPEATMSSAHQMGTCRMGATEKGSVVDPRGQVWGVENVYVADTSVFPSASGVNPSVTALAIADWISREVGKGLRMEGRVSEGARL